MQRTGRARFRGPDSDDRQPDVVRVLEEHCAARIRPRRPRFVPPLLLTLAVALVLVVAAAGSLRLVAAGVGLLAAAVASRLIRNDSSPPLAPEQRIDAHFDPASGLPFSSVAPLVLADRQATETLTGRLAVMSIEVRAADGLDRAPEGLLASVSAHRLIARKWIGRSTALYGPMFFLNPPHGFVVVLRDVMDRRTTAWLAHRLAEELSATVRCGESTLTPQPVIGVAVGSVTSSPTMLLRHADEARVSAILHNQGPVAMHGASEWAVGAQPDTATPPRGAGTVASDTPIRGKARDVRHELEHGLEAFENRLRVMAETHDRDTGDRLFVSIAAAALCRSEAVDFIVSAIRRAGLSESEACVVAPPEVERPGFSAAWSTIAGLRERGVPIYLEAGPQGAVSWRLRSDHEVDGIVLGVALMAGADTTDGFERLSAMVRAAHDRHVDVVARVSSPRQRLVIERLGVHGSIGPSGTPIGRAEWHTRSVRSRVPRLI